MGISFHKTKTWLKWRVAIKRIDETTKKLWMPGPHDVVCCDHFTASDRQLIERSSLCSDNGMLDSSDAIMADRGIMVQDLFGSKDVAVDTPKMLKGKSRFEPQDII